MLASTALVLLLTASVASAADPPTDTDSALRRLAALPAAVPVAAAVAAKEVDAEALSEAPGEQEEPDEAETDQVQPDDAIPVHIADKRLHLPLLNGRVVRWFGTTNAAHSNTRIRHTGWTIRAPQGNRVRNVADGEVVFVGPKRGYGKLVVIAHPGGYHSVYAHLDEIRVEVGERVERGQAIATLGSSGSLNGPKLYFEWRLHGRSLNPQGWFAPAHTEKTLQ